MYNQGNFAGGNFQPNQCVQGMNMGMNQGIGQGINPQGMNMGMNQGINQGMNRGMNMGMNQGINQSMNQGMNQGINQSMNQNMNMGMNQGIGQGINPQGMNMGMNQGINQGMNRGMNMGMNQGMNQGINQGMNIGMNQGMNQGINQSMNQNMNMGMNQGMNQGINQGMNIGMNQGINQSMNPQGINQGMNQSINQSMNMGMNYLTNSGSNQVMSPGMNHLTNSGSNQVMSPGMNHLANSGSNQFNQGFQMMSPCPPLSPQPTTEKSNTWIDKVYESKGNGYYLSLYESMLTAGFLKPEESDVDMKKFTLAQCHDDLILETNDKLGDVNIGRFIEDHRMTKSEATAVAVYTYDYGPGCDDMNIYSNVNQSLYDESRKGDVSKYVCYMIHLLRGLRKLDSPKVDTLYRIVKNGMDFTEADIGKKYTWYSFTSTSASEGALYKFSSTSKGKTAPIIFVITGAFKGHCVKDISYHPSEEEVIIEPGMEFIVKKVEKDPREMNCKRVTIEVVDTPPVLSEAVEFFTAEEKRREFQISSEALEKYVSKGVSLEPLCNNLTFDQALSSVKTTVWCPAAVMSHMSQIDAYQGQSKEAYKTIYKLVAASTKSFFPTLSDISSRAVKSGDSYFVTQIQEDGGCLKQVLMRLEGLPCGISTKIIVPKEENFPSIYQSTSVFVMCTDTMEIIKQTNSLFPQAKIACLNMGGQDKPGGGWNTGLSSLEESLFMRTTLSASLEEYLYPMKDFECIYTKDVTYIRNGKNEGFRFLDPKEHFKFDIITTCAFNLKKISYEGNKRNVEILDFTPEIEQMTYKKIRAIFSACASNGAQVLILGALGCGAFKNPSNKIAMLFRQVIQEFAGVFNTIIFSIWDTNAACVFSNIIVRHDPTRIYLVNPQANPSDGNVYTTYQRQY